MSKHDLRIISYNVRGLNNQKKRTAIFQHLHNNLCDVALLQETYSSEDTENQWVQEWGGKGIFLHGTKHSKGIAILIKKGIDLEILQEDSDRNNRIQFLKIKSHDNIINLFNVYAPTKETEQITFMNSLLGLLQRRKIDSFESCIFGGDWNIVLDIALDKSGGIERVTKRKYWNNIVEFTQQYCVVDIWRIRNKAKKKYTWRQKSPRIQSRLDFFLLTEHLQDIINTTEILPSVLSDHSPISLTIKFQNKPPRGPGYWKLNVSLLQDKDYITSIKTKLNELKITLNHMENKNLKWEIFKYEIRQHSIQYSKYRKKNKTEAKVTKEKRLQKLLEQESTTNEAIQTEIDTLKDELDQIYLEEAEGAIVRSRAEWHEKGEKNTSYFFNLEKTNAARKNITKLNVNNRDIITPKEILSSIRDFYKDLYSKDVNAKIDDNEFILQNALPRLDEVESKQCEGAITNEECERVLHLFKSNKSPGNDGIPIEFYREFWKDISKIIIDSYNYSYEKRLLSTSQRQAVISLINKPGKDRLHIENWRPISLLNVDYKIMSKCLSERIKKVITKLVHHSQFGFVKGRNINDALRTILDIVDETNINNRQGLLLALDFQKAFDSISWDYLFQLFKVYNFGEGFISWIRLCYTNISSCVMNFGFSSAYFEIQKGVRQGDSLSPYIFLLALELLTHKIRENNEIRGIRFGEQDIKLVAFADDTTVFLRDETDATKLFKILQKFEKVSGLKINRGKSEGFWLGAQKNSYHRPLGIKWKTCIKILGITISYDKEESVKLNFDSTLLKIKQKLNVWKQRDLTIYGKILLIKTYALSQILYLTSVLPVPEAFMIKLDEIIFNFLWNGKAHKVKKSVIIQDVENGGCNMISVQDMIRTQYITWIKKYQNDNISYWKITMKNLIRVHRLDILLQSQYDIPQNVSEFYQEVLKTWQEVQLDDVQTREDVHKQYLWYNMHLPGLPINNPIMHNYMDNGIVQIKDIVKDNGTFKSMDEIVREFNINSNTFLFYQSVVQSIPQQWKKDYLKTHKNRYEQILSTSAKKDVNNMSSKEIYTNIVRCRKEQSKANKKYTVMFDITDEEWKIYYTMYDRLQIINKAKEMQYKILHDYVATNKLLYKMTYAASPRCNFCNLYHQDTCHLFFECMEVKNFWMSLNEWLMFEHDIPISISLKTILFGELDAPDIQKKIVLYAKLFIFQCKYKENVPLLNTFIQWIKQYRIVC